MQNEIIVHTKYIYNKIIPFGNTKHQIQGKREKVFRLRKNTQE